MMYLGLEGSCDRARPPHHLPRRRLRAAISPTSSTGTGSPTTRRSTSATPRSPIPTMAPGGHSSLYVLVPVTHQHPNVDWRARAVAVSGDRRCASLRRVGVEDVETPDPLREGRHAQRLAVGSPHLPRRHVQPGPLAGIRCCTCARATASRISRASTWSAAAPIPGSGLPVIYESARITSRLLAERLRVRCPEADGPGVCGHGRVGSDGPAEGVLNGTGSDGVAEGRRRGPGCGAARPGGVAGATCPRPAGRDPSVSRPAGRPCDRCSPAR